MSDIIKNEKPTVQELMKKTGRSKATIYNIAKNSVDYRRLKKYLINPPSDVPENTKFS